MIARKRLRTESSHVLYNSEIPTTSSSSSACRTIDFDRRVTTMVGEAIRTVTWLLLWLLLLMLLWVAISCVDAFSLLPRSSLLPTSRSRRLVMIPAHHTFLPSTSPTGTCSSTSTSCGLNTDISDRHNHEEPMMMMMMKKKKKQPLLYATTGFCR
jgi:hypothetical protein